MTAMESIAAKVTIVTTQTFTFPDMRVRCPTHGQSLCIMCARNPNTCETSDSPPCGYYSLSGMHWDTCANRIDTPL